MNARGEGPAAAAKTRQLADSTRCRIAQARIRFEGEDTRKHALRPRYCQRCDILASSGTAKSKESVSLL